MPTVTDFIIVPLATFALGLLLGLDRTEVRPLRLADSLRRVGLCALGWLLGAVLWTSCCRADAPAPLVAVTTHDHDTLSGLAHTYAPGRDWREWAYEVRRRNGRLVSPWVRCGVEILVPDWRQPER